jgi:hypothetical protein
MAFQQDRYATYDAIRFEMAWDLAHMPDDRVLQRSLNVRSIIFTPSSFAQHSRRAANCPELQNVTQIGEGQQGTVFEQVRLTIAPSRDHANALF